MVAFGLTLLPDQLNWQGGIEAFAAGSLSQLRLHPSHFTI